MSNLTVLEGAAELDALLRLLPDEIAKVQTRKALMAGARVVARRMKASTPVGKTHDGDNHPGFGKRSIRAKMASPKEIGMMGGLGGRDLRSFRQSGLARGVQVALAGASPKAFYLRFVEWGWAHRNSKGGKVTHIAAKPFLRPAWEASKAEALQTIIQTLTTGIFESARKLAGPYATSGFSKRGRTFIR